MNADGIDNFDLTTKDIRGVNPDMVKRISDTFKGEVESLQKFREQIRNDIQKTGLDFDMPRFDKNFSVDFEEFRAGAKNFYQKKYVHNCVTGSDSTSLGLSAEQILSGLRQRGIRGSGAGMLYRNIERRFKISWTRTISSKINSQRLRPLMLNTRDVEKSRLLIKMVEQRPRHLPHMNSIWRQ